MPLKLASDYLTQEEADAATKFKKIKKTKKVKRRMLKADDLIDQLEQEDGSKKQPGTYNNVEMDTMPPPSSATVTGKLCHLN